MDNENKKVVDTEAEDTDKAMQSFLSGSNDYEAEKPAEEAPKTMKLGRFDMLICVLSVMALGLWTMSNYGTAVICGIAVLLAVITKPGKDAVHTVCANGLCLATALVIKAAINACGNIFELFMNATKPESVYSSGYADWVETYNSFSNVINTISSIINVAVFVVFVINAFFLISKKRTVLFGKVAAKLSDRDDENTDSEEGKE